MNVSNESDIQIPCSSVFLLKRKRCYANSGGLAVAVPGLIKGLYAAWLRYGRLEWSELVLPTARLLRKGIPCNRVLRMAFDMFPERVLVDDNLR